MTTRGAGGESSGALPSAVASDVAAFFASEPVGTAVFDRVVSRLAASGPIEIRVTKSQVALRRRRGFAYLWRPRQYLDRGAPVVLSIALARHDPSPRFKEVVDVAPGVWLHHLEVRAAGEIDDEVGVWLNEAATTRG